MVGLSQHTLEPKGTLIIQWEPLKTKGKTTYAVIQIPGKISVTQLQQHLLADTSSGEKAVLLLKTSEPTNVDSTYNIQPFLIAVLFFSLLFSLFFR